MKSVRINLKLICKMEEEEEEVLAREEEEMGQ
jgi:hypothetical protein